MSDLEVWLVIIFLTIATVIDRSAFWVVGHHINLPKRVQEALRYAPACALAAIIVPDLFVNGEQIDISITNPKMIAGILATLFFLWRRNMLMTIVLGMSVFTAARLWIS
ncbi:AzlD domain-containing protein [Undibacterium sp. LX40W]|uniref:AzlD domain-containing protein n=1 Tax=Undibacterium nitidum TaxID=2762298 RepID=A0A923HKP9_9BURK|nr:MULTISPECIES: AzlD domain-containing protein [Undibacterium]MBC3880827.1 AzlD domain-containing protein [Undibacterium nitidum]MBC3890440.1 AzlD domain-containing protein [Undibacterium sp. LX40W]